MKSQERKDMWWYTRREYQKQEEVSFFKRTMIFSLSLVLVCFHNGLVIIDFSFDFIFLSRARFYLSIPFISYFFESPSPWFLSHHFECQFFKIKKKIGMCESSLEAKKIRYWKILFTGKTQYQKSFKFRCRHLSVCLHSDKMNQFFTSLEFDLHSIFLKRFLFTTFILDLPTSYKLGGKFYEWSSNLIQLKTLIIHLKISMSNKFDYEIFF